MGFALQSGHGTGLDWENWGRRPVGGLVSELALL